MPLTLVFALSILLQQQHPQGSARIAPAHAAPAHQQKGRQKPVARPKAGRKDSAARVHGKAKKPAQHPKKKGLKSAEVPVLTSAPIFSADTLEETPADSAGMNEQRLTEIDRTIEAAISAGVTPGASLAITHHGKLVRLRGYGRTDWEEGSPVVTSKTLYDLASVTKVASTTLVALKLAEQGTISLDAPVYRFIKRWPHKGRISRIRIRHLLTHTSGLPASGEWYDVLLTKKAYQSKVMRLVPRFEPGTHTEYSDISMMVLGWVIEQATRLSLADLAERKVYKPLGLRRTLYLPLERISKDEIAPTEKDTWFRFRHIHGTVHDPNAARMGGVSGHAGLFSDARDLIVLAEMVRSHGKYGQHRILSEKTAGLMFHHHESSRFTYGWDTPSPASAAGRFFSAGSIGHTGFTGTSIWIDPEKELAVVLLTNRVNPTSTENRHKDLRRAVHDLAALAVTDQRASR